MAAMWLRPIPHNNIVINSACIEGLLTYRPCHLLDLCCAFWVVWDLHLICNSYIVNHSPGDRDHFLSSF